MAKQTINIGTSPNDGTGTPLRTSFDYCNLNFTELYTATGPSGNNIVVPGTATITGAATVGTTLGVTGASTLASVGVTGAATVGTTLLVGTNATLTNGNVIIGTSGKGIDFSATANSSGTMTSELLADYEEGTFTPSIGGTATYTTQTGRYTKIGNRVFVTMRLTVLLVGTGSTNTISGLPFTVGSLVSPVCVGYFANLALSPIYISGYANDAASTVTMTGLTAASATITNAFAVIGNAADLAISFSYEV